MKLRFDVTALQLALCRLDPSTPIPIWAERSAFVSITRTSEELSVVCDAAAVPPNVRAETGWACMKLAGPIPLTESGVLAAFISPLVAQGIPLFAISTFYTDYVLVKNERLPAALAALERAGHELTSR